MPVIAADGGFLHRRVRQPDEDLVAVNQDGAHSVLERHHIVARIQILTGRGHRCRGSLRSIGKALATTRIERQCGLVVTECVGVGVDIRTVDREAHRAETLDFDILLAEALVLRFEARSHDVPKVVLVAGFACHIRRKVSGEHVLTAKTLGRVDVGEDHRLAGSVGHLVDDAESDAATAGFGGAGIFIPVGRGHLGDRDGAGPSEEIHPLQLRVGGDVV